MLFFTAIFEPLILKRRFSWMELLLSLITLAGVLCIFSFDSRYRYDLGIAMIVASVLLQTLSVQNQAQRN